MMFVSINNEKIKNKVRIIIFFYICETDDDCRDYTNDDNDENSDTKTKYNNRENRHENNFFVLYLYIFIIISYHNSYTTYLTTKDILNSHIDIATHIKIHM